MAWWALLGGLLGGGSKSDGTNESGQNAGVVNSMLGNTAAKKQDTAPSNKPGDTNAFGLKNIDVNSAYANRDRGFYKHMSVDSCRKKVKIIGRGC
jgi:hypothetical protein